jgi:DNA-binding CsgD family transcriptional regulator
VGSNPTPTAIHQVFRWSGLGCPIPCSSEPAADSPSPRRLGGFVNTGEIARFMGLWALLGCPKVSYGRVRSLWDARTRGLDVTQRRSPMQALDRPSGPGAPPARAVKQAAVRLVEEVLAQPPSRDAGTTQEAGPLLDARVKGFRCIVVRDRATARSALSPRERQIVDLVASGHPNKSIASTLGISQWTVSTHLRRLFARLGVGSRAAMVARLSAPDLQPLIADPEAPRSTADGRS